MVKAREEGFHKCVGCFTERLCGEYRELWFCIKGPARCWRKRESLHAVAVVRERKRNISKQ